MDDLGVDINGSSNGVFLPTDNISGAANHRTLHTNDYYNKVNTELSYATTKEEAEYILNSIAERLSNNTF